MRVNGRAAHGSPSGLGPLRPAQHRHVRHPVAVPPQVRANARTSILNTITSGIDDNNSFDVGENPMIQLRDTNSFGINDTNSFNIIDTFRNNAITQERKTDIQINNQYPYLEAYRARPRATAPDEEPESPCSASSATTSSASAISPRLNQDPVSRYVQCRTVPCAPASSSRDGPPNRTVRAR